MAWRQAVGLEQTPASFCCPVCRSASFFQTAEGYYVPSDAAILSYALTQVCDVCFTQSQDHGALEVNDDDDANALTHRGRSLRKGRVPNRVDDSPQVAPLAAFQEILRMQVEALILKYGCNELLYPIMAKLWVQYTAVRVEIYANIDREKREIEAGTRLVLSEPTGNAALLFATSTAFTLLIKYLLHSDATMEVCSAQQPMPPLSLCFCFIACAILREPVTLSDLALWANTGELPFEGVYVDFNGRVKKLHLIRPKYHATVGWLTRTSYALVKLLNLPPLPPPNVGALAPRYLKELLIPEKFTEAVLRIASRVSLDTVAAIAPHSIVLAIIVVLLKLLWDPEGSGIPLSGTDLPSFEDWAHALLRRREQTTPLFAAKLDTLLQKPREYAKFCDEQVMPLTKLKEVEPVFEIFKEIANSEKDTAGKDRPAAPESELEPELSPPPSKKAREMKEGGFYTMYHRKADGDCHSGYQFLLEVCGRMAGVPNLDFLHRAVQDVERDLLSPKVLGDLKGFVATQT